MRKSIRNPISRNAFTLIELLVVMTVIGILVGMLMPAVQWVRRSAETTRCKNHLKQLSLVLNEFADNHSGQLPAYSEHDWVVFNAYPQTNTFRHYLENISMIKCPVVDAATYGPLYGTDISPHYGFNFKYLAPPCTSPSQPQLRVSMGSVATSRTVAFGDTSLVMGNGGTNCWLVATPFLNPPSYHNPTTHFRHGRSVNISFVDGHVETQTAGPQNADLPGDVFADYRRSQNLFDVGTNDSLWTGN
jgi:prepilin-type N-terminal cleavage/methylation domain-containing protein/prepilin-type processing-associated H-X9-DG protein